MHRGLSVYANLISTPRTSAPKVFYLWGAAGSGKTRAAWECFDADPERVYVVPLYSDSLWFDGYDSRKHTVILFDEFFHNFKFRMFNQLIDRYRAQVPVKNGFVNLNSKFIVFTSNIGLHQQYPNCPDQDALWRRFTRVLLVCPDVYYMCDGSHPVGVWPKPTRVVYP
nr:MAG TPA: Rep protein [Circoviridae sp.]